MASARWSSARQRAEERLLGSGGSAWLTRLVAAWVGRQLLAALRRDPEPVARTRLGAGESVLVTTRPAPNRRERRLQRRLSSAEADLRRRESPSRALRKVDARLGAEARRLERARAGSRRHRRRAAEVARLTAEHDRLSTPSRRVRSRRQEVERLRRELEVERQRALERARPDGGRPAVTRRFP